MKPAHELPKTQHEFVPVEPGGSVGHEGTGYLEKEYEHQEYPKDVNGELVDSAEEEAALKTQTVPAKTADDETADGDATE